jgi:serine/threonine protein phosphatase PrpC
VTTLPAGVGVAAEPGLRSHMEDRWAVQATPDGVFAAVYDGHGGARVADQAAALLHLAVLRALRAGLDGAAALREALAELAEATADAECGSTVAAFLLARETVTTAHLGDSRVVRVGHAGAEALTRDHRIDAPDERARVLSMGAYLEPPYVMRGDQGLMMTRSLGDRWFRPVGVIADPEIGRHGLRAGDVAVVAATDGLWDVLDLDDAARVVRQTAGAQAAARALVEAALEGGTTDNVTAIVVRPADLSSSAAGGAGQASPRRL